MKNFIKTRRPGNFMILHGFLQENIKAVDRPPRYLVKLNQNPTILQPEHQYTYKKRYYLLRTLIEKIHLLWLP